MTLISIIELVGSVRNLLRRPFRVTCRRVEVLVTQDLGQPHKIVVVVGEVLMAERVAKQMRVQLDAGDRTVLGHDPDPRPDVQGIAAVRTGCSAR